MTHALILAAGKGERLRPLTDERPKCLAPLLGKSLLEHQVATLNQCGITDIHIAVGYRAEQIQALGFETTLNPKFAQTNMVETLFSAEATIDQADDLIIAYGDIVYQPENLQALLDAEEDLALMIDDQWRRFWEARMENPLDDAETLKMDERGYVTELGKKPRNYDEIQGQYTGLIKIKGSKTKDLIAFYHSLDRSQEYDGKDFENMYMTSFLQLLIDTGWDVKAVKVSNGWLEVDTGEDLRLYNEMAAEGELDKFYRPAMG